MDMKYRPLMEHLPLTAKGFAGPNSLYEEFRLLLRDDIVRKQKPMTVRQVFYQAVVKNYVEKTEKGYDHVQGSLTKLRKEGKMPYEWIDDRSRSMQGSQGSNYDSIEEYIKGRLEDIPDMYFINLLADHEFSIQVWLEKEALAGVIERVTGKWDVPLIPAKGYSSLSLLYEAAQDLERKDRPIKIFHFGDYDPSGQNAIETIQRDLPGLFPKIAKLGIEFNIVAVTPEQIVEMDLPTRPTKKSDPRSKNFEGESVELDAIEPNVLRQMVDETLRGCFPAGALEAKDQQEEAAREEIRERLRGLMKEPEK